MKKYKWIITGLLLLIMILEMVFLGSIKMNNIDMTDMRLFITYWKEYTLGIIITSICYLGIKKVLNN
ncbi:MAG: hypothetical protein ACI4P7_06880 [Bacilli bacterium]